MEGDVTNMWVVYALGSALFAAFTSILAKLGMGSVNSNLATAIRTAVVLVMAWGIVLCGGSWRQISQIQGREWMFLLLSGLATGASWLCYFKAVQIGEVSRVVPVDKLSVVLTMALACIFLKEPFSLKTIFGGLLITVGALLMI